MRFNHIYAIALRQYFLMRGSMARVMQIFVWVIIDIVLWGFITRYLNSVATPGFNFISALLGAILMWDFFARVSHGITIAFFEDVWSRNFLNIFATPLTIGEYLSGLVVTAITTSLAGLAAMLLLATSIFGLSLFAYGVMIIPFIFTLFLFGIAIGIAGSAMVLRLGPSSEWFIWPIPALLSPFVGVFYPLSTLPAWMHSISYLLPPAYVFENMRALIAGQPLSYSSLILGMGLACLYIVCACNFFSRIYKHAVRSGLIARYSAESVS